MNLQIGNEELMTHTLSNMPEDYDNIKEILRYNIYNGVNPLTIERLQEN